MGILLQAGLTRRNSAYGNADEKGTGAADS
jgi:hypothetical protein